MPLSKRDATRLKHEADTNQGYEAPVKSRRLDQPGYPAGYAHPGFIWLSHPDRLEYHPPWPYEERNYPRSHGSGPHSAYSTHYGPDVYGYMQLTVKRRLGEGWRIRRGA